jgi:NADPH2:quinone reductase
MSDLPWVCKTVEPRPQRFEKRYRHPTPDPKLPMNPSEIPTTMHAAINTAGGGPEVLQIQQRPVPTPSKDEVLVRVMTSALNRADLIQRAGRYPAPPGWPADIPGLEFAGVVAASGPGVQRWKTGDRVFGLVGGGAHAEYLVVSERAIARVPDTLSWAEAGSAPEAFITAHDALITQAGLRPGETVLIHAVGSGVALAAVQLVRAMGANSYGTARRASKIEAARSYGLRDGIVATDLAAVAPAVMEWTHNTGVNIVLDLIGGEYVASSVASLAMRGRLMLIGSLGGRAAALDLGAMMSRRLTVRGTSLRSRPIEERILAAQAFEREVVPWLGDGTVTTRIDATFPLADIAAAHARLESNDTIGKIVLTIGA